MAAKAATETKKYKLAGGTTRSEKAPAYHLVPPAGPRRTALRFGLGAEIHGAYNWLKSLSDETNARAFAEEAFNHMQEHMNRMAACVDPQDDHLGAIGWAQAALAHVEEVFGKPWTELDKS
jgi:hypothetical protein